MSKRSSNNNPKNNRFFQNRSTTSKVPPYILIPISSLGIIVIGTYHYFQDEMPYTKRKRLLATSLQWEKQAGDAEYKALLHKYKNDIFPPSHRASMTVHRVGNRIAKAAQSFAQEHHVQTYGSEYTYTVVRSNDANAFVLPNNHVFVLSGLFQFVQDEDSLAAVLGHEMAHNLARHAGERVSSNLWIRFMARCTLFIDPSGVLYSLFLPLSTVLYDLPHSRDHEVEADYIGLQLVAEACYDPKAARRVFQGMKDAEEGGGSSSKQGKGKKVMAPPEFMSSHPSYDTRLNNFDLWMPNALEVFNADAGYKCSRIRNEMKMARAHANKLANQRERRQQQ